ncbi:MAG: MBL fold metallo-hydrolase [Kiritimatiellae bacterium]|nr:MBL fold metallo-hydrolase [Kiritimatiellia bacterium]MCO5069496.1 MBL fold metallo-hydrolase [Kiritimatiellia bacterium]
MSLRASILASGSSGNCTYIASEQSALLIDAGLSAREVGRRLERIGASIASICGICVSHEHGDHTQGLRVLNQRSRIPLYANAGTVEALSRDPELSVLPWQVFTTGAPFQIGDLRVEPFAVPHDAFEPVGFVVACGDMRVGVVTDMGMPTTLIRERLRHCRMLVLESNHDEQMLQDADRPWHLKQRIRGRQGHLSNQSAAAMLAEIAGPQLSRVYLAHLSADCNRPDLAQQAVRDALMQAGHHHVTVHLTYPDRPTELWVG